MQTGKGIDLPDDLARQIDEQPHLREAFEHMRPSCQRGYVEWIAASTSDDQRIQRVARVVAKITRWGKRHQLIP